MTDPIELGKINIADQMRWGRHEAIRRGQREPIPPHVRSAVWYRDSGICRMCPHGGAIVGAWEIDHIVPWSAGGSDDSTNLRVLCQVHNQERSNFHDPFARPQRPATRWCLNCFSEAHHWQWTWAGVSCPTHPHGCRVTYAYQRWREITGEWPDWHRRAPIDDEVSLSVAYCAHCDGLGITDQPL